MYGAAMSPGRAAGVRRRVVVADDDVLLREGIARLQLPATDEDHRRVLAVLLFLDAR